MFVFYEIIKGIYFLMTLFVGLFFLRGHVDFKNPIVFQTIGYLLMPFYLILTGVIVGYVISLIRKINIGYSDNESIDKIDIRTFLIGIIIGCIFAMIYIFVK